jgi:membrane protein implicated in regulation of membrane protease activity
VIWTGSVLDVVGTGAVAATIIWLGYAVVSAFLRRRVIRRRPDAARAAVIQVFALTWVGILHGALAVWLLVPHAWSVVCALFIVLMGAVGRTSYRALTRFEEIAATELRPDRPGPGEVRPST